MTGSFVGGDAVVAHEGQDAPRHVPLEFTKVDERPIDPSGDTPVVAGRLIHDR